MQSLQAPAARPLLGRSQLRAQRSDGPFVVMFLDLDRFKEINDTLGHDVGDLLLIELARRLRGAVREEDTVSRLGGDEFVVVLPGAGQDIAQRCSERILTAVLAPYVLNGHTLRVTASIGMAVYPDDGADAQALLKNADTSMYQAKSDGRNGARFFSADMAARVAKRAALTTALRNAIPAGEFRLAFQPQVDLADGRVRGVEALLRWNHPDLGNPGPAEFIPVAEESGLILPISQWVLGAALRFPFVAPWLAMRGGGDGEPEPHFAVWALYAVVEAWWATVFLELAAALVALASRARRELG